MSGMIDVRINSTVLVCAPLHKDVLVHPRLDSRIKSVPVAGYVEQYNWAYTTKTAWLQSRCRQP